MKILVSTFIIVLLTSCGSITTTIPSNKNKNDLLPDSSFLILSTRTQNKGAGSDLQVLILRKSDKEIKARFSINNNRVRSHFPDGVGYLNVFELPAGTYLINLYGASLYSRYGKTYVSKNIEFTVAGGDIAYLGEIYFNKGNIVIRNKFDRDIKLFTDTNPSFSVNDFEVNIPTVK